MSDTVDHFTSPDDDPESVNRRSLPKRAESDAMDRCKYIHPQSASQCKSRALPGKEKCAQHDIQGKNARKSRYNFARHASNINELMQDDNFTSMNEEISALRQLLEIYWNQCTADHDFFMHGHKIEGLVEKIQRVLSMSKKLEVVMGKMVDEAGFNQFTNEVIQIISDDVEDKVILNRICGKIGEAIERAIAKSAASAEERIGS